MLQSPAVLPAQRQVPAGRVSPASKSEVAGEGYQDDGLLLYILQGEGAGILRQRTVEVIQQKLQLRRTGDRYLCNYYKIIITFIIVT